MVNWILKLRTHAGYQFKKERKINIISVKHSKMCCLVVHILIKSFNQYKDRLDIVPMTLKTYIMHIRPSQVKINIIRLANPFLILMLTLKERRAFFLIEQLLNLTTLFHVTRKQLIWMFLSKALSFS